MSTNLSCNHLAEIVMTNPMLYAAPWNKGRNQIALANLFRRNVYFDDGFPMLNLPLINNTQTNAFAATLSKHDAEFTRKDKSITIAISWAFGKGWYKNMH
jgi:hypothetical protein